MNIFNKLTAVICALLISLISWSALAENDVKNTEFSQAELEQMLAKI